jgi:hypothetical protein
MAPKLGVLRSRSGRWWTWPGMIDELRRCLGACEDLPVRLRLMCGRRGVGDRLRRRRTIAGALGSGGSGAATASFSVRASARQLRHAPRPGVSLEVVDPAAPWYSPPPTTRQRVFRPGCSSGYRVRTTSPRRGRPVEVTSTAFGQVYAAQKLVAGVNYITARWHSSLPRSFRDRPRGAYPTVVTTRAMIRRVPVADRGLRSTLRHRARAL